MAFNDYGEAGGFEEPEEWTPPPPPRTPRPRPTETAPEPPADETTTPPDSTGDPPAVNEAEYDSDLFDYTGGSLLTPFLDAPPQADRPDYKPYGEPLPDVPEIEEYEGIDEQYPDMPEFDEPIPELDLPEFQAPTFEEAMQDPSYQFRLKSGSRSLDHAAASRGMARSGNVYRSLMDFGQRIGSQQYQQVLSNRERQHQIRTARIMAEYSGDWSRHKELKDQMLRQHQSKVDARSARKEEGRYQWQTNAQLKGRMFDARLSKYLHGRDEHRFGSERERIDAGLDTEDAYRDWQSRRDTFWQNQDRQFDKITYGSSMGAGVI